VKQAPYLASGFLAAAVALMVAGCQNPGHTRDFSNNVYKPTEHFRVQFVLPGDAPELPMPIESLLLLPPYGVFAAPQERAFHLSMWQELQQLLPGVVRTPRDDGLFGQYMIEKNLMRDDGRPNADELERLGRLAGTSHLMLVRIIDYRPYHPQRIIMEWQLIDIAARRTVLTLAGALDASEQQVLQAARQYHRNRDSSGHSTASLDLMLRSPREYNSFAIAQAVDALKGWVRPAQEVVIPRLSY
jgi:hypothetical protein